MWYFEGERDVNLSTTQKSLPSSNFFTFRFNNFLFAVLMWLNVANCFVQSGTCGANRKNQEFPLNCVHYQNKALPLYRIPVK
jgi:hypothetical protein